MKMLMLTTSLAIAFWLGWRAFQCWDKNYGASRDKRYTFEPFKAPFDSALWAGSLFEPLVAAIVWAIVVIIYFSGDPS